MGQDKKSEHLFINNKGRFGCVAYSGEAGKEHRKRIFALIGNKSDADTYISVENDIQKKSNIIISDVLGRLGWQNFTSFRKKSLIDNLIEDNKKIQMNWGKGIPSIPKTDFSESRYNIISDALYKYEHEDHFQDYRQIFFDTFAGTHTIQTLNEFENNRNYERIIHFDDYLSQEYSLILQELNKHGVGIYMCVNETNGKSIKNEDIIRIRAVFADFNIPIDGLTVKKINERYKPSMIIDKSYDLFSSTVLYIFFWLVNDCPLYEFSDMQHKITYNLNSNPNINDLSVIVPVHGFINSKEKDNHC